MKRARYRDVPKDYRRNYFREFLESVMILAMTFGIVTILVCLSA